MRLILSLLLSFAFLSAAQAQELAHTPEVKAVEAYLNSIRTLKARFVQTAHDGTEAEGVFLLKRPGRMRFDYAPPPPAAISDPGASAPPRSAAISDPGASAPPRSAAISDSGASAPSSGDFIVADGRFIYYYDARMQQQSNVPISRSLADFFLRPQLKMSGDLAVSGVKRDEGLLQVTLVQAAEPLAGYLTLAFAEDPLQLKGWRVVDAQGLTTTVRLEEIESGLKLSNELFHYYDPARQKPYRAN
jgi:outer membrane lipoprotein-sorting protein